MTKDRKQRGQHRNAESWKLTLPCTREEAEALTLEFEPLAEMDSPPVLMTSEPDAQRPDQWQLDAYFEGKPNAAAIRQVRELVPSAQNAQAELEKLPDEDRSEEHTSELQSLMRISYAVFCLKKKKNKLKHNEQTNNDMLQSILNITNTRTKHVNHTNIYN